MLDGDDASLVFLHCIGHRLDHDIKRGFRVPRQRCGLGGVPGDVEKQGRVMVGDQVP